MKKVYEVGVQFLIPDPDQRKPKIVIKTFRMRRGCIEDAIMDGYKAVRKYLNSNYEVYKLEDFAVEEVYYHE